MPPKVLALIVEGDGDVAAAPHLIKRILKDLGVASEVRADPRPLRVGGLGNITGRKSGEWPRFLNLAARTRRAEGVLLLLDGDSEKFEKRDFCAKEAAAELHRRARSAGAGQVFSAACVFACMEYESWFLAAIDSLAGKPLPPDGRPGVRDNATFTGDTEVTPRGAKAKLSELMINGYKATTDQEPLTRLLDLDVLRDKHCRSFARLENAVKQLVEALRTGNRIPAP